MRTVNLSQLDAKARNAWWQRIQSEAPKLAELLQNEQFLKLRIELGAQVIIHIDNNGKIING